MPSNKSPRAPLSQLLLLATAWLAVSGCFGTFFGTAMPANLREQGIAGTATILDIWDTGWTVNDDPVIGMHVRVQPPDGAAFPATIKRLAISRLAAAQPRPGQVIHVRFDPKDPTVVVLDHGTGD